MYELNLSDRKFHICFWAGTAGFLVFLAGLILCLVLISPHEFGGHLQMLIFAEIPAALCVLLGYGELIDERVRRLRIVLSRRRLYRGFGLMSWASLVCAVLAVVALFLRVTVPEAVTGFIMMPVGAALCSGCMWVIFRKFTFVERLKI